MTNHWPRLAGLIAAACTVMLCRPAAAQSLTEARVEDSIVAIGNTVQREYPDAPMGRQVAASLREGLSEGRFPNLTTAQDVADAMNHELQFLTHDPQLVVRIRRKNAPPRAADARAPDRVRVVQVNDLFEVSFARDLKGGSPPPR